MIDAAVRIFGGDVEMAQGARFLLESPPDGKDDSQREEAVAGRFDEVDSRGKTFPWRRVFLVVSILAALCLSFPADRMTHEDAEYVKVLQSFGGISSSAISSVPDEGRWYDSLSPEAALLLGDPDQSLLRRRKELWDSSPDNAAYFAEYATAYYLDRKVLPPGYFETAGKLDPDNAWFDYFGAAVIGKDTVKKGKRTQEEKDRREPAGRAILKPEAYREAVERISLAGKKPRFDSYEYEMMRRRIAVMPQGTPRDRLEATSYVAGSKTSYMALLTLSEVFWTRAHELDQAGDKEGFIALLGDSRTYILRLSEDPVFNLVQELVVRAVISGARLNLKGRAEKLGITAEAAWVSGWGDVMEKEKDAREARREHPGELEGMVQREAGFFAALTLPLILMQVEDPPPLTAADIKPGRLFEYMWLCRAGALALMCWLAVAAVPFFLYRFRASRIVRIMARRITRLLSPVDWLWIIAAGVALPVLLAYAAMMFTPIGGWDRSFLGLLKEKMIPMILIHIALGQILIIVPILVIRWRLRLKAGPFGFKGRDITGWLAVLSLVAAVAGWRSTSGFPALLLAANPASIWLLVTALLALFSGHRSLVRKAVVARLMIPVCAAAVLLMFASAFAFDAGRTYWFKRDDLMRMVAEEPGVTPYEYRLARQMREDLQVLLKQ